MDIKEIAAKMSAPLGVEIKEEMIVKLPEDDYSYMGQKFEVYAARCGKYTVLAYDYGASLVVKKII